MKVIRIGRDPENDHVAYDDYASAFHCEIFKDGQDNAYIVDTDSRNGTFINGREIPKQREWKLNEGDIVKIGSETFVNWQALLGIKRNTTELPSSPSLPSSSPPPPKTPVNWKAILGVVMTIMSLIMMVFMLLKMFSQ